MTTIETRPDSLAPATVQRQLDPSPTESTDLLDLDYQRVLASLQTDGPRAPGALVAALQSVLRHLESSAVSSPALDNQPRPHTTPGLSARVWWRLTRPE